MYKNDKEVNIWGYKFLVPYFITELEPDEPEFLPPIYCSILDGYLTSISIVVNWKEWNQYKNNCVHLGLIELPIEIEDYYDELNGECYTIKPLKLSDLTENDCIQLFLKCVFDLRFIWVEFINKQLSGNQNPLEFLAKINSLVLNYHKTDIGTLRKKKYILVSINSIKEEIENLFPPLKELQSTSSPTKLEEDIEEDLAEPRTLNSILILLDKIGFFQLPQVENLSQNKKGELIAFLTKYAETTCKVTIKEMSTSSSAHGRNNPYMSNKAIKDANNFLTKLNS
jgi:hypothetical protein